ncbi:hypothetical protein A2X44_00385 [candidate division CPR3 bacterium GWF2_35_18]|uniref:Uncharacterized protein n=1 Tax=candidate division CPR3 bacterium GW2011_GWF2_35_18 TaxID=1618350 RepID=A0A0G0C262_UNCC3|nr:MAG: hypothetical protein UR67_C0001G0060 [candidate division CPR3 bacterium GW2011_GWF2_35_18]KKP86718.1 MAG: hypothetical protein UR87_C0012G0010 [candidate division CPR3 bacterium GW2011_GWE2_35_7]OGB63371.1 MAG: hypothetical protein A2X44_00385 [candidate division CPR3 bacterium GWF2_35_18]OGB64884.1 MAG: hypothetical protein A2250_05645 [candidate division CPR3 bacterium RIFOXYA2_FULL_35_13]OGB77055.1 MAG: hypothetical protein A2476_02950 [candidate division CPR3 bacterium RIFOXYC2_FULL
MKYKKSDKELKDNLNQQIIFLKRSFDTFDKGNFDEGIRIATSIRVLLHDTQRQKSLLTLLGIKEDLLFYDTAISYNPNSLTRQILLVEIQLSSLPNESRYKAPLSEGVPIRYINPKIQFETWWSKNIVIKDESGNTFSRKDLILNICDKEGGAHVDLNLDNNFALLSKKNLKMFQINKNTEILISGGELVSIRQIGYEVLRSLEDKI